MPIAAEDQRLLLYIDKISVEKGVAIPWNDIALAFEPRGNGKPPLTGEAIKQHIAKLRTLRAQDKLEVPAKVSRSTRRATATGNKITTSCKRKAFTGDDEEDMGSSHSAELSAADPPARRPRTLAPLPKKLQAEREKAADNAAKKAEGEKKKKKQSNVVFIQSQALKAPEPEQEQIDGSPVDQQPFGGYFAIGGYGDTMTLRGYGGGYGAAAGQYRGMGTQGATEMAPSGGEDVREMWLEELFDYEGYQAA